MIHTMVPFRADMNYGRALNEAMAMIPDGDWLAALDHDALFTTRLWHGQLEEAVRVVPEVGLLGVVANRIGPPWQRAGNPDCHDIEIHREVGLKRAKERRTLLDVTGTRGLGGVLMVMSKQVWTEIGGFADGLNCVDHAAHFAVRAKGRKVYILESLYLYHWRRANGDGPPEDAPRAANCPCRGPETMPMVRVRLP